MTKNTYQNIAHHLINAAYTVQTRRSESVIQAPYRHILDPYFDSQYAHSTYPLNSLGSLTRLTSDSIEFFVNIPQLYRLFRAVCVDPSLVKEIEGLEKKGGLSAVRDIFVDVLRIVGEKDFEEEGGQAGTSLRIHFTCPYLRIGARVDDQRVRKIYRAPMLGEKRFAEELFVGETRFIAPLLKGDYMESPLPENILRQQFDGQEFTFVVDISEPESLQYATSCTALILPQLGYRVGAKTTEGAVSAELAQVLCDESRGFILSRLRSPSGYCFFDFMCWLAEHSEFKKCLFPESERTQHQLISRLSPNSGTETE